MASEEVKEFLKSIKDHHAKMDAEEVLFYDWEKTNIQDFLELYKPSMTPLPVEGISWYYIENEHPSRIGISNDNLKDEVDDDETEIRDFEIGLEVSDDGQLVEICDGVVVSTEKLTPELVQNFPKFIRTDLLVQEWSRILTKKSEPVSYNLIRNLENTFRIGSGKWLLHSQSNFSDKLWAKVCKAIHDGKFPPCCSGAKVSTTLMTKNQRHVICVYNDDWLNQSEVISIERAIRSLGITATLRYKPDIITHLNIYQCNDQGIRPSILRSSVLKPSGYSLIASVYEWDNLPNVVFPGPEVFLQAKLPSPD